MTYQGPGYKAVVDGNTLTITIDVSEAARKNAPRSNSGKSNLLASTGGFVPLPDAGVKLGLNVIC